MFPRHLCTLCLIARLKPETPRLPTSLLSLMRSNSSLPSSLLPTPVVVVVRDQGRMEGPLDAPAARCGSSGGGAGVMMNVKSPPHRGRQRRPPARGARRTAAPAPTDDLDLSESDQRRRSVSRAQPVPRRTTLGASFWGLAYAGGLSLWGSGAAGGWRHEAIAAESSPGRPPKERVASGGAACADGHFGRSGYFSPGPFKTNSVRMEHTCSALFPTCVGDRCLLKTHVFYPAPSECVSVEAESHASSNGEMAAPRPRFTPLRLAIITSGFLVASEQYVSYAERLASHGYVAVLYDKQETLNDVLNDEVSALFISEIIDWLGKSPSFGKKVRTDNVYAIGHSRGGKVSLLAAENDPRIGAVCLLDPVDVTSYAPEGPGFPSAVDRLVQSRGAQEQEGRGSRGGIPIAIIGGGKSPGDCIPADSG